MKTKELIRRLQAADPSGEIECCIGNADIVDVENLPAYYDGRLQVLDIGPNQNTPWGVIGAKYVSSGRKLLLRSYCITDAVYDQPQLPVDCTEAGPGYADSIEDTRKQRAIVMRNVELDMFQYWARQKAVDIESDLRGLSSAVAAFFDQQQMTHDDNLKVPVGKSYRECRFEAWDAAYAVSFHDLDWHVLRRT